MGPKVLALIENSIGVRLTLAARLTDLGCRVTIVSAPEDFDGRLERETFDWIFLDEAAVPPHRRRFFVHLAHHRGEARVVWCGKLPGETPVRIEAVFAKPLRYAEIQRFFSYWTTDTGSATSAREAVPWKPVGRSKRDRHTAEETRTSSAESGGREDTMKREDGT